MNGWDIFDPMHGRTLRTFRWRWMARLVARVAGLDYARHGEGW